ncbi:MAG: hypothetical protein IT426_19540 [Pirellulales bacterium]|nr:hypothetical protein [Pirellulales bacterium]
MRYSKIISVIVLMLLGPISEFARAEIFVLTSGGRVVGELLNPDENPRKKYVVQLAGGSKMTLDAAQVEQVLRPKADLLEYEKIRADYPDTVAGQWALAEWCRERKLLDKRETHLKRILELEPDHADARRLLGYAKIDGKWARRDDLMRERGYVFSKGKWMLPQEVERQAEKSKHEASQSEWARKIALWRRWLGTKRDEDARAELRKIADPAAVKALVLGLRGESAAEARLLLVEALRNIDAPEAERALAIAALDDVSEEVRLTCLDFLKTKKRPEVVAYFVGKLKAKDNVTVNLAGVALREMKDPSAVGPLIDALVTTHKFKIVQGGGEGSTSSTFSKGPGGGGGGLSVGGRPQIVEQNFANQAVLDALVAITGQNFAWDQAAWKGWAAAQKKPETLDARRD